MADINGSAGGVLQRLNAEWHHLAGSPATAAALQRWTRHEPALAGVTDLHTLHDVVHDRDHWHRADTILAALTRLAAVDGHNDPLAARVLLQLLVPRAAALSRHLAGIIGDYDTAQATVLSELAIGIRTFPWQRRPRAIAANLLLDAKQRIIRSRRRNRHETPTGLAIDAQVSDLATADNTDTGLLAVRELLTRACRTGIIDTFEANLLFAHHALDIPISQLVPQLGKSRSSLYAIRADAEKRLRKALAADPASTREG